MPNYSSASMDGSFGCEPLLSTPRSALSGEVYYLKLDPFSGLAKCIEALKGLSTGLQYTIVVLVFLVILAGIIF